MSESCEPVDLCIREELVLLFLTWYFLPSPLKFRPFYHFAPVPLTPQHARLHERPCGMGMGGTQRRYQLPRALEDQVLVQARDANVPKGPLLCLLRRQSLAESQKNIWSSQTSVARAASYRGQQDGQDRGAGVCAAAGVRRERISIKFHRSPMKYRGRSDDRVTCRE